jgi:hypothetical protein
VQCLDQVKDDYIESCDVDKIHKGICPKNEHPIAILSPKSGDSLTAGNLVNITWNGGVPSSSVSLLFRYDVTFF